VPVAGQPSTSLSVTVASMGSAWGAGGVDFLEGMGEVEGRGVGVGAGVGEGEGAMG
jgi:hypothetical protein